MAADFDAKVRAVAARFLVGWPEAAAYLRGRAARKRGARLTVVGMSCVDAWFAAGWHDADIESGVSVLAQLQEGVS